MTTYNKSTLKTFFAQGDVPQGTDYANLIDSQVNLVETASQAMAGPLTTTELDTPLVSATNINVTTTLSAVSFKGQTGNFSGMFSAKGGINVTTVSATTINAGTYRAGTPTIVSAAGTAQATASPISSSVGIVRLQGVTDGQATGFLLPSPTGNIGIEQSLICESAVSCNLWPNSGCKINGLSSNAAFAMAANTMYFVVYSQASAYAVK